jgi:hypothetical protein
LADQAFQEMTPLGFEVRATSVYWELIVSVKHPVMQGEEDVVRATLRSPDQIRRSRRDPDVYLFYKLSRPGRWNCVVARRLNGEGFLVTAYPTDAVKEGDVVWIR